MDTNKKSIIIMNTYYEADAERVILTPAWLSWPVMSADYTFLLLRRGHMKCVATTMMWEMNYSHHLVMSSGVRVQTV